MTPFQAPDPEMMKQYQRSQLRLAQAFQLFMLQIAHGSAPRKAIELIDEAMDTWSDYEDAHRIELPGGQDIVSGMMGKFNEVMDGFKRSQAERQQSDLYAVDPADITAASVDYCERLVQVAAHQGALPSLQLVADCSQEVYYAGAAQMLRMLHGNPEQPFPYKQGDLSAILEEFGLLPSAHDVPTLGFSTAQPKEDFPNET